MFHRYEERVIVPWDVTPTPSYVDPRNALTEDELDTGRQRGEGRRERTRRERQKLLILQPFAALVGIQ